MARAALFVAISYSMGLWETSRERMQGVLVNIRPGHFNQIISFMQGMQISKRYTSLPNFFCIKFCACFKEIFILISRGYFFGHFLSQNFHKFSFCAKFCSLHKTWWKGDTQKIIRSQGSSTFLYENFIKTFWEQWVWDFYELSGISLV